MATHLCPHPEPAQTTCFPAADYITGERFDIRQCAVCGLVRTWPVPAEPDRYYPTGYYGGEQRYPRALERLLEALYDRRAAAIERGAGVARGRVLDIGCGRGQLLRALRSRGWTVLGTELTDSSARFAREAHGLEVLTGPDSLEGVPAGSVDVVILWHVLEHIAEPDALLARVGELLAPGGTALVAVPNYGSLEAQWGRDGWFHLDVPRHLVHFTPATLGARLRAVGLQPVREVYVAPEYDLFSAVQTALNRLGIRHNLLYNLIRSRGAKLLSGGPAPARDSALTLVLAPLLAVVALVWIPVAAVLQRGAAMTVFARKP